MNPAHSTYAKYLRKHVKSLRKTGSSSAPYFSFSFLRDTSKTHRRVLHRARVRLCHPDGVSRGILERRVPSNMINGTRCRKLSLAFVSPSRRRAAFAIVLTALPRKSLMEGPWSLESEEKKKKDTKGWSFASPMSLTTLHSAIYVNVYTCTYARVCDAFAHIHACITT